MKYKISDRVIIKENIEYALQIRKYFLENGRIMIIQDIVNDDYYILKEFGDTWHWNDDYIEGLAPPLKLEKLLDLTITRFELMDFE